jgi:hypothetical protein
VASPGKEGNFSGEAAEKLIEEMQPRRSVKVKQKNMGLTTLVCI